MGGRRGRGARSGDVGVVAHKREGIAALARPFVHTSLDIACAADFEEDFTSAITGIGWGWDIACSSPSRTWFRGIG